MACSLGSIDNGVALVLAFSGLTGKLQQHLGPLKVLKIACIFKSASFIAMSLSHSSIAHTETLELVLIYTSRVFAGISRSFVTSNVYIVEVIPPEIRGMFLLMEMSFRNVGNVMVYALGYFIDFNWYGPVFGWLPIICLIWMQRNHKSPVFLAKQNLINQARHVSCLDLPKTNDIKTKIDCSK